MYDLYGDDVMKGGGGTSNPFAGMQQQYRGNPFQGNRGGDGGNPFQGFQFSSQGFNFGGGGGGGDVFEEMISEMLGGVFGGGGGGRSNRRKQPAYSQTIEKKLMCTLEELHNGIRKKLRVKDTMNLPPPHGTQHIEKIVTVDIKPGYREGTKITFPPSRDFPKSITFILKETEHRFFKRYGKYDLIWICKLTQLQIDTGVVIKIPLLDGKKLTLNSNEIKITNGYRKRLIGYGMPTNGKDSSTLTTTKGDLIIEFKVSN